jgi:hypothetical protein
VRAPPEHPGIDERGIAADDAIGLESVDAPLDRGCAQRDTPADVLERTPCVVSQERNDLLVDLVDRATIPCPSRNDRWL